MWSGICGPVPQGHRSALENECLWRWERSCQCPVLRLKVVACAYLSTWWILFSSVPPLLPYCPEVASQDGWCSVVGYEVCRLLLLTASGGRSACLFIVPSATVGRAPLECPWCSVVEDGQLLLDVAKDRLPLGDWRLQDGPAVRQEHCWLQVSHPDAGSGLQGAGCRLALICALLIGGQMADKMLLRDSGVSDFSLCFLWSAFVRWFGSASWVCSWWKFPVGHAEGPREVSSPFGFFSGLFLLFFLQVT